MMDDELQPCPACNQKHYRFYSGGYDEGQKIDPDTGECALCGFRYSEHVQHPFEEQLAEFMKAAYSERFIGIAAVAAAEHDRVAKTCKQVMWVADALKHLGHADMTARLEQAMLPFLWEHDYDKAERIAREAEAPGQLPSAKADGLPMRTISIRLVDNSPALHIQRAYDVGMIGIAALPTPKLGLRIVKNNSDVKTNRGFLCRLKPTVSAARRAI